MATPLDNARKCFSILNNDLPYLEMYDAYVKGIQRPPYVPDNADAEFKMLVQRATTNVCDFTLGTVMQPLAVDNYRATSDEFEDACDSAFRHFQRSRMDARQSSLYRAAGTFGHAFTVTEKDPKGRTRSRALSPLRTATIYDDPASDDNAVFAVNVTEWPSADGERRGTAVGWDQKYRYDITFKSLGDKDNVAVSGRKAHGLKDENPVTRFALLVDLEGNTTGLVAPMIVLQDRLNQSVFDLLVTQTYASFKVRTVTGMAPPMKMEPIYGEDMDGEPTEDIVGWKPVIGPDNKPIPENINLSQKRFMFAEDSDTKFGTLDETPLDGFINSINMSLRQIAALSQTPPHHMMGEIANLSAEALKAAEQALSRKVREIQNSFGESWERVFRLSALLDGIDTPDDDDNMVGEVIWRGNGDEDMAAFADFAYKVTDALGLPGEAFWPRVPGVTKQEMDRWRELREDSNEELIYRKALERATNSATSRPSYREDSTSSDSTEPVETE